MKSFIIFCRTIAEVGGNQLYARNKALYYKSLGWDVNIFSFRKGTVYIKGLEMYENRISAELGFPSFMYSKKKKERLLDWILTFVSKSDEYVIESDSILLSTWAEELAHKVQGRHFLYLLDEQPRTFGLNRDFLDFKFNRNEVAGISENVIKYVFPDKVIDNPERFILRAFCINSIDDIDDSNLHIQLNNDVKIGVFGRLNKTYMKVITQRLIDYISKNKELSFTVIYIGGSPNKSDINYLYNIYKEIPNAEIDVTGYICPVPRNFVEKFDFFISTAGSTSALYRAGLLTISIDVYNYNPNGIMGITTDKTLDPEENQPQFEDVLDDLIIKKRYNREQLTRNDDYNLSFFFEPHVNFVERNKNIIHGAYFDFNSVRLPLRFRILKVLLLLSNPVLLRNIIDKFVNVR